MKHAARLIGSFLLASLIVLVHAQSLAQAPLQPGVADLVVVSGKVWTVDPAQPQAQAIAAVAGRIVAVGTDAEIRRWIGASTRVVDAGGKTVLPGFIDSHVHFSSGGFEISGVQLRDAATPDEFARRIGEHAKKLPKGEWILGGTWDHELWGGTPPERDWIDKVTPEHPVFVSRYDGHMGLANSLALKLAGITRDTPTPAGGSIVKDANGEPMGLLKDAAIGLLDRVIPVPNEEQLTRAIQAALGEARRFGVTGIHDISSAQDFRIYQNLAARGELTARMYCLLPIRSWESVARVGIRPGFGSDWVRTGALKAMADGSLGSTTALFYEPYNDAPDTAGLPGPMMFPEGNMQKMALGADQAGLQLCIHAIGDKANRLVLDIFDAVAAQNGGDAKARRFRIEHAQHIRPGDFNRFAQLGVISSMQPYHAIDDGRWAEKRIGLERCKTTYAFRTFLDSKVKLAFGSDWSVAPLDPIQGIYAAVTRRTLDGKNPGGWFPEQKITLAEAIEAYTMGSAYAEFSEKEKGSLTVGKFADIVVLDSDLFGIAPERIKGVKVRVTIVGGNVVYESRAQQTRP